MGQTSAGFVARSLLLQIHPGCCRRVGNYTHSLSGGMRPEGINREDLSGTSVGLVSNQIISGENLGGDGKRKTAEGGDAKRSEDVDHFCSKACRG